MKAHQDPRHIERIKTMQELFSWDFSTENPDLSSLTQEVITHQEELDPRIAKAAPSWPIEKINKIDLAILRLATYELFVDNKAPVKVIIDEAVELAKEYGSDSSPSFVNGALGKMLEDKKE